MSYSQIEKERDEAMISLDKEKILAFYHKMGAPKPSSEEVLWAGVHKTRLHLPCISNEGKELSRNWLINNGYTPNNSLFDQLMANQNN